MRSRRGAAPGRAAERHAERMLRRIGYVLLARNLRVGRDEIDLLLRAPDGRTIVLVEVKSSTLGLVRARAALGARKRHRVARAIRSLERMGLLDHCPLRIDAVFVDESKSPPTIEHLEGRVFQPCQ